MARNDGSFNRRSMESLNDENLEAQMPLYNPEFFNNDPNQPFMPPPGQRRRTLADRLANFMANQNIPGAPVANIHDRLRRVPYQNEKDHLDYPE